jgi:hypothetical protein
MSNTLRDPGAIPDKNDYSKPSEKDERNLLRISDGTSTTPVFGRITRSVTRVVTPSALLKEEKRIGHDQNRSSPKFVLPPPPQPSIKKGKEAVVHDVKSRLTASMATLKKKIIIPPPVPGKSKERRSPLVRSSLPNQYLLN